MSNKHPQLFFALLFFAVLILGFFIIKPFLTATITGIVLAVLSFPLYKVLRRRISSNIICALLVTICVALIILLPLFLMFGIIAQEAFSVYRTVEDGGITAGNNLKTLVCQNPDRFLCKGMNKFTSLLPEDNLDFYVNSLVSNFASFISSQFSSVLALLPGMVLNFFVMLFVLYYVVKDHKALIAFTQNILPLKKAIRARIVKRFGDVTFAVFYGHLLVALTQGGIAAIGYFVVGVDAPLMWAFLTVLFALLPFLGTAIVWIPLSINLILQGVLLDQHGLILRGVILILYGFFIIGTVDNILRPKIIGSRGQVHPVLVLLGVLGGISLFGFVGVIIGPVILAIGKVFVEMYEKEKSDLFDFR